MRRIQRTGIKQDTSVVGRIQTWQDYFHEAFAKTYFLGQGKSLDREIHGTESHSTYVSLITIYGIGGVIWAIIALIIFLKKALYLRNSSEPLMSIISTRCFCAIIIWCFYGIMADATNMPYTRYLLFYLAVLVDRTYNIAVQQQWQLGYDAEQVEHLDMQPVNMEIN